MQVERLDAKWILQLLKVILSTKKLNPLQSYLSDEEMEELGNFLLSDTISDETMMPDCLDGFLTALVTAPVMPASSVWLPQVWGPSVKDESTFDCHAQLERITGLIMRHFGSLIFRLQENPDACEPLFDSAVYPDSSREFIDGEMWAHGFMSGIELQRTDWQPCFDDPVSAGFLRPIYLLGTEDISVDDESLIATPEQREELSKLIPESVAGLYRFWAPIRRIVLDPAVPREYLKIGRNEKCPCGSGRKFKKCCGVTPESDLT